MGKRNWLLIITLALVVTAVGLSGCSQGSTIERTILSNQQEGIWVTGTGEVSGAPDIVTLRLGIEAQEKNIAEAQTQAAEAMNKVMSALAASGVAEKDIQTQYFSIRRVTRWDREKDQEVVVGYRVTNLVTAKIRDVEKAGTIIDAVAEAGGDLTRVDSIGFSIDDPSAYYEEARPKAMADARARAEQLAELAGVTLDKPTYISEGIQIPPPIYPVRMAEAAAPAPETPISPGEMEVSLTVQVAYAILD